jgi:hypothetical protein
MSDGIAVKHTIDAIIPVAMPIENLVPTLAANATLEATADPVNAIIATLFVHSKLELMSLTSL